LPKEGKMALTPVEMQRVELKRSANGYDCAEADRLIEEFAEGYEAIWLERIELQERVEELERRLGRSRRRHRLASGALLFAAALAGAVVLWLGWEDRSSGEVAPPAPSGAAAPASRSADEVDDGRSAHGSAPVSDPAVDSRTRAARVTPARLVLRATRGESWLMVRRGSESGPLVYEGTLASGRSLRLAGKRLWLRVGAPANLAAELNGKRANGLPSSTADVVVTRAGIRLLSAG
jgi:hypothetical protein